MGVADHEDVPELPFGDRLIRPGLPGVRPDEGRPSGVPPIVGVSGHGSDLPLWDR
jgi:hypothetical protein